MSTIFAQTPQSYRQKVASLQKMHVIRPSKDRRKRRFTNSNSVCSVCREEVPLTQTNHLLQHCIGIMATPPVVDSNRDLRAFSKRCIEIAQKRLKPSSIATSTPTRAGIPTRVAPLRWGLRDGESISELNPREKRVRHKL